MKNTDWLIDDVPADPHHNHAHNCPVCRKHFPHKEGKISKG